jgi:hypothetical protein
MSVWPVPVPTISLLSGSEGALVLVSIGVAPGSLESLLETLAEADFPINPQIYHNAVVVDVCPDGRQIERAATLVEFPAYSGRLDRLWKQLETNGFDPAGVIVRDMLEDIQAGSRPGAVTVARAGVQ